MVSSQEREGVDHADFRMEAIFLGVLINPKFTTDDFLNVILIGVYQVLPVTRYFEYKQWRFADVLFVRGSF